MNKENSSSVTVSTEQVAAYQAVKNGSSGLEPQSDGGRDVAISEGDEPQVIISAGDGEQLNSEMKEEELKQVSGNGTASFSEENTEVDFPKADKEGEQNVNNNARMENPGLIPMSISTEQATVQATVESDNIGIKPQGSATPDSNVSAKDITAVEGGNLLQVSVSASEMEQSDLEVNKDESVQVTDIASFSEDHAKVESPNADKEIKEKLLLTRSTLPKHGSCFVKLINMQKSVKLETSVNGVKMPNGKCKNQNSPLVLGVIVCLAAGAVCGITCICKKESAPWSWSIRNNSDQFINDLNIFSDEYNTGSR